MNNNMIIFNNIINIINQQQHNEHLQKHNEHSKQHTSINPISHIGIVVPLAYSLNLNAISTFNL
jgi:hypothetical protein